MNISNEYTRRGALAHLLAWLAAAWVWCACRSRALGDASRTLGRARSADATRLDGDGRVPASRRLDGPAIGAGNELAG